MEIITHEGVHKYMNLYTWAQIDMDNFKGHFRKTNRVENVMDLYKKNFPPLNGLWNIDFLALMPGLYLKAFFC